MQNYTVAQNSLMLIARFLFSFIFIFSGCKKILAFDQTVNYMMSVGLTVEPHLLATIAIVFELGGGILLLLGWYARIAGLLLFIFTLAAAILIHPYWAYAYDPANYSLQMIQFMKNITLAGGTLYIISFGGGAFGIDGWLKSRRKLKFLV